MYLETKVNKNNYQMPSEILRYARFASLTRPQVQLNTHNFALQFSGLLKAQGALSSMLRNSGPKFYRSQRLKMLTVEIF